MRQWVNRAISPGYNRRPWPALSILILGVVLPSAGVLWFMNEAMHNEQLAVRQRLAELYQSQLESAAGRLRYHWQEKISQLAQVRKEEGHDPVAAFATLVKSRAVDSVLLYDSSGALAYPDPGVEPPPAVESETPAWQEARRQEFEKSAPAVAAKEYLQIARQAANSAESAQALLARARCLSKAGQPQAAIQILTRTLGANRYCNAIDAQGRMIVPNALLLALSLMKGPSHPDFPRSTRLLVELLNDYGEPAMPAGQRRFLMQQLRSLWPECPIFPTLDAEDLAAAFAEAHPMELVPGQLQITAIPGIWSVKTFDNTMVALFREDHLLTELHADLKSLGSVPGVWFTLLPPGRSAAAFLAIPLGGAFSSWLLALSTEGHDPLASVSNQRRSVYLWTGILMTVFILLLSLLIAAYWRRQIKLTQLKNDLLGTVSHELKTPLASMRLLVDTLLAGQYQEEQQVRDYLQMIAKENTRLSCLIDNFLTFSRLDRHKVKFEQAPLRVEEIVRGAVDALGERLQAQGCRLEIDLAADLPCLTADRAALVTVLVNLLDNALKYTGNDKWIRVSCFASKGHVCIDVEDNGIGFPRAAAKRIFDRFYQADRSLSRLTGGCGLGLSIVRFIVAGHGGVVTARSQPGKGSTFTIRLPAAT